MKCPYCSKTLDLKTNPILLNDYRTSVNQLLLYCYKCKKYYVKLPSKTDAIIYYIICGIISVLPFVFKELPIILKFFISFVLLIISISLYIYVKLFLKGCMVECDEHITPVIKKAQYKIITTQLKYKNTAVDKLINGTVLVDDVSFPIIITVIYPNDGSSIIEFYCLDDQIELTGKNGTVMIGNKEISSGPITDI